ncbi:hypothetical protein QBC39DRAFT_94185 [Podospora conica]|nr:hypothetical protein QBC39DRAFT_94185 [Schizothecium conicum]
MYVCSQTALSTMLLTSCCVRRVLGTLPLHPVCIAAHRRPGSSTSSEMHSSLLRVTAWPFRKAQADVSVCRSSEGGTCQAFLGWGGNAESVGHPCLVPEKLFPRRSPPHCDLFCRSAPTRAERGEMEIERWRDCLAGRSLVRLTETGARNRADPCLSHPSPARAPGQAPRFRSALG